MLILTLVVCLIHEIILTQIKFHSATYVLFALTLSTAPNVIIIVFANRYYAYYFLHEMSHNLTTTSCSHVSKYIDIWYKYTVTLPNINLYLSIVKYKCSNN